MIAFNAFVLSAVPAVIFLEVEMPDWIMVVWVLAGLALLTLSYLFLRRLKEFSVEKFLKVAEGETAFTQSQIDMLQKQTRVRAELLQAQLTFDLFDDIHGLSEELTKSVLDKVKDHRDEIIADKAKLIAQRMGGRLSGDS